MTRKTSLGKFDPENIAIVGIGTHTYTPSSEEAKRPRIANNLYLGQVPKNYTLTIYVDGMTFSSNNVKVNFKAITPNTTSKNIICFIMELENDTIQFVELDNILNASGLKILNDWITHNHDNLLIIANEYECFNRQFYHFMYDIVGLVRAISNWDKTDQDLILNETRNAQSLLHNRVHAEIFSSYKNNGTTISLFPEKLNNSRKPDLKIENSFVDIKAIILTNRSKHQLLKQFSLRLEERIEIQETDKDQIGLSGTFFIAIWSGIISSTFYVVYNKMKNDKVFSGTKLYDTIPPFEKEKVVFVLPHPSAFESYYFIVPRKRAVRIAEFIYKKGLNKIQKSNVTAYLTLVNIRKGCSFGLTGKNPNIMFKIT